VATKKKQDEAKSNGKQYDMSVQEKAIWGMISAKFELASEKERSANEIRQTAQILKEQWLKGMLSQRSIKPDQKINVDIDAGVIRVLGVAGPVE
jgi:hypothetical protein